MKKPLLKSPGFWNHFFYWGSWFCILTWAYPIFIPVAWVLILIAGEKVINFFAEVYNKDPNKILDNITPTVVALTVIITFLYLIGLLVIHKDTVALQKQWTQAIKQSPVTVPRYLYNEVRDALHINNRTTDTPTQSRNVGDSILELSPDTLRYYDAQASDSAKHRGDSTQVTRHTRTSQ